MEVLIVGAGVAGSYIGARLAQEGFEVRGFESQRRESYNSTCAWATSLEGIGGYLRGIGIDVGDYVLYEADGLDVEVGGRTYRVAAATLATVDKPALIRRMAEEFKVEYGVRIAGAEREILLSRGGGRPLFVDATGAFRSLIGPADRGTDEVLPTYQLAVRYRNPPHDGFYVRPFPRYSGYLWYFPLGGNRFFVGAGDSRREHLKYLSQFLDEHRPDEVLWRGGRPLRISPPGVLRPIAYFGARAIVSVGEAAGSVFPILGEGILPSVESAELLARRVIGARDLGLDELSRYEEDMRSEFSVFRAAYRFVKGKQGGTCRYWDPRCAADAMALAAFFLSARGRKLTGVAPSLRHAYLALKPF